MRESVCDNDPPGHKQMKEMDLKTDGESDKVEMIVDIYEGTMNNGHPSGSLNTEEDVTQSELMRQKICYSKRPFTSVSLSLGLVSLLLLAGIMAVGLYCKNITSQRFNVPVSGQQRENMSSVEKQKFLFELSHFCGDGCRSFNHSFYYISTESKIWEESRQDCIDKHADLIIINSREEQEFVSALRQTYWIGLSDREEEGMWKWVDGSILNRTEFWAKGKPRSRYEAEDCVTNYWYNNFWYDTSCDKKHYWICEKPWTSGIIQGFYSDHN